MERSVLTVALVATGGSFTPVTVTVNVCSVVSARPAVPPVAVTITMYSLLPAAFTGFVLATSAGLSWSGASRKLSTVVVALSALSSNRARSAPPVSA